MAEDQNPKAKETSPRTSSPEDPEALLEKVLQQRPEVLRAVVEEFFQRRMHMTGRGVGVGAPELTDAQKELEEKAKLFRDATSGPSNEQLKDSTKAPPTIRDVYGEDPPEWALKRINK